MVLISRALVVADSRVAPVLTISEVSETNALLVLQAWPGDYVVEASTDLRGVWSGLTNLSVGRGGTVKAAIPFLESKHLFLRAVGLTPSDGAGCLAQFQTLGSTFEPEVRCDGSTPAGFVWIWNDGTTNSDYPIASKDFGRIQLVANVNTAPFSNSTVALIASQVSTPYSSRSRPL